MSFDNHYKQRYVDIYKPAIEEIRLNGEHMRSNRVDETGHGDSIITEILRGIAHAAVVLVDVSALVPHAGETATRRNGNVMYELGLAHAVKSPSQVLIVRDDSEPLLFDLSSIPHETISFDDAVGAKRKIAELLRDRIKARNVVVDIKLRRFLERLSPDERMVLDQLAKCPEGKALNLTVSVDGWVVLPAPTRAGIEGLRNAALVRAHNLEGESVPFYSLTSRGRSVCQILGIATAVSEAVVAGNPARGEPA